MQLDIQSVVIHSKNQAIATTSIRLVEWFEICDIILNINNKFDICYSVQMDIFTQCHVHPEPFSIRRLVYVIILTTCLDAAEQQPQNQQQQPQQKK